MNETQIIFGIMNQPPSKDRDYGPTQYWARVDDGPQIEFTTAELDRPDVPPKLAAYIRSLYIKEGL